MKGRIFVMSGAPASGKTTISRKLVKAYPYGYHIPVDTLRSWVVSGNSDPIGSWDDETERQFQIARDGAASLAKIYARAGFAVIIDDVIFPDQVEEHYMKKLRGYQLSKILLKPDFNVVLERNRHRNDPNQKLLENVIKTIYSVFEDDAFDWGDWHVIDSSDLSIDDTVEQIQEYVNSSNSI